MKTYKQLFGEAIKIFDRIVPEDKLPRNWKQLGTRIKIIQNDEMEDTHRLHIDLNLEKRQVTVQIWVNVAKWEQQKGDPRFLPGLMISGFVHELGHIFLDASEEEAHLLGLQAQEQLGWQIPKEDAEKYLSEQEAVYEKTEIGWTNKPSIGKPYTPLQVLKGCVEIRRTKGGFEVGVYVQ